MARPWHGTQSPLCLAAVRSRIVVPHVAHCVFDSCIEHVSTELGPPNFLLSGPEPSFTCEKNEATGVRFARSPSTARC